jgi:CheY-like chemotaxis protein
VSTEDKTETASPATVVNSEIQPEQLFRQIQSAFSELQQNLGIAQQENRQRKLSADALMSSLSQKNSQLSAEVKRLNQKIAATLQIISTQVDRHPLPENNSREHNSHFEFREQIQLPPDSILSDHPKPAVMSIHLIEILDDWLEILEPLHKGRLNIITDQSTPGRIEINRTDLVRLLSFLIDIALQSQLQSTALGLIISFSANADLCKLRTIAKAEDFTDTALDESRVPEFLLPLTSFSESKVLPGKGKTAMVLAADPLQRLALKQRIQYFGCSISQNFTFEKIDLFLVTSSAENFFSRYKSYIKKPAQVWMLGQIQPEMDNPPLKVNLQKTISEKFQQWSLRKHSPLGILIVDDEPASLAYLKTCFEDHEQPVYTASTGKEALALVEKMAFSLALIDLHLPEEDGANIARKVKARQPGLQVIGMTAASEKDASRLHHPVFTEILFKPIDPIALQRLMDNTSPQVAHSAPQQSAGQLKHKDALPVFDARKAIKAANGRAELAIQMLAILTSTLPEDLTRLKSAWHRSDQADIQQILHKLKGALEFTAAPRLQQFIRQADKIANDKSQGNLMKASKLVISETENLLTWLQLTPEPFKGSSTPSFSYDKSQGKT